MTMYITALAVCFTLLSVSQGKETRCEAPTVPEGSPANITCFFGEDVRLSKKNVKVLKISGTSPSDTETVVECSWSDSQTFKCEETNGYQLQDHQVTNKAVVLIPRVSKLSVGTYMCEAVPSDPADVQVCELRIEEINDVPNLLIKLHEMQNQLNEQKNLTTAVIIITAVTFITLHIGLVVFCNRKRLMQCFHRRGREAMEETEEENVRLHDIDKNKSKKEIMRETVEHAVMSALIKLANAEVGEHMFENLKQITERLPSKSPDEIADVINEDNAREKENKKQLTPERDGKRDGEGSN